MDPTPSQLALFKAVANTTRADLRKAPPEPRSRNDFVLPVTLEAEDHISTHSSTFQKARSLPDPSIDMMPPPALPVRVPPSTPPKLGIDALDAEVFETASTPPDVLSHHSRSSNSGSKPVDSANLHQQKLALLQEYRGLQQQHPRIIAYDSRMTEEATFEEIQLALIQAKNTLETSQGAEFLKDGLRIGATGLEWVTPKITRQKVSLEGWSNDVANEIGAGKYDMVLAQIYRRNFRSSSGGAMSNPMLQLVFMLLTSAGIFAFKKKMQMPTAPPVAPAPMPSAPMSSAPMPSAPISTPPPPAPQNDPQRPRMRPPNVMTGESQNFAAPGGAGGMMNGADLTSIAASIAPALNNIGPMLSMIGPMMNR